MLPKIVKKEKTYNEFECYMCGGKLETIVYNYQSAFRKDSLQFVKNVLLEKHMVQKEQVVKNIKKL